MSISAVQIGDWIKKSLTTSSGHVLQSTVFLILALGALFISFTIPHLGYVQEFTVGGGVITDSNKLKDIWLVPLAVFYQLSLILALGLASQNLNKVSLLAVIAIAVGATAAVWRNASEDALLCFTALLFAGTAAFRLRKEEWAQVSGHMLISSVGLTLIANRIFEVDPVVSFCGSIFIISILPIASIKHLLPALTLTGTIVVAVTLVFSMPSLWYQPHVRRSEIDAVHFLLAATVLYSGATSAWCLWKNGRLVSPVTASAMAIFVLVAPHVPSPFLPEDDYHFGEKLLAAQALVGGGSWFTSFFSPHGLSDAGGAAAAWLLGDFTASGIAAGDVLWLWYPTALLAWLLVRRVGPLPAIAIMIALPISDRSILLLTLNLVLATEAMVLRPPFLGGAVGTAICFGGVFLNAGLGAASAIFAALVGLGVQSRGGRNELFAFLAGGTSVALLLCGVFFQKVLGQMHFLVVSSESNLTIYGNGQTSTIYNSLPHFLFAMGPAMAFALSWGRLPDRVNSLRGFGIIICLVIPFAIYAIVVNSYASARLDDVAVRALFASYGMLVVLPVFLSLLWGQDRKSLLASVLCAALLAGVGFKTSNLSAGKPLLPPLPIAKGVPIADDIPLLGTGYAESGHVGIIREVKRVADALLSPDETFINLTNRNALYFYLNRPNPVPIASTYNAAPEAFQKDFLKAIKEDMPALALVSIENIEHDGLRLPLRSHMIYDFVMEHYFPFNKGPYTYAIRKDLVKRLDRLPDEKSGYQYSFGDYTDQNWEKGVAIGLNAKSWSFALPPILKNKINVGDELLFSDGVARRVLQVDEDKVLTRPTLTPPQDGKLPVTSFSVLNREVLPSNPWEQVLHQQQLHRIPSTWGRSLGNLSTQMSAAQIRLEILETSHVKLGDDDDTFSVSGDDPFWVFAPSRPLTPGEAGLLALDIRCLDSKVRPMVQVFWRSSMGQFSENASLLFEASFVRNLVPLDSTPFWSLLPDVAAIRVDVVNSKACKQVELKDFALFSRLSAQ